jgi:hypothetical protein
VDFHVSNLPHEKERFIKLKLDMVVREGMKVFFMFRVALRVVHVKNLTRQRGITLIT